MQETCITTLLDKRSKIISVLAVVLEHLLTFKYLVFLGTLSSISRVPQGTVYKPLNY